MMPEQQLPHQALHQSVLLREVVAALSPANDAIYLDATFGNGGYSRALLEAAGCKVIAIDRDPDAIQRGQPMLAEFAGRFSLFEGCFSQMAGLLDPELRLAGAAFDLGVCSTQLDQPERGFSFRIDGPLDMRMSKSGDSAADVVMQADERMHQSPGPLRPHRSVVSSSQLVRGCWQTASITDVISPSSPAACQAGLNRGMPFTCLSRYNS